MTRRERERREQRRQAARRWARWSGLQDEAEDAAGEDPARQQPARPSSYGIKSVADWLKSRPLAEVYLYGRVSTKNQNLGRQLKASRRHLRKLGVEVLHAWGDKAKDGKSLDPAVRLGLMKALEAARRRGVPLVVPCISRLLRDAGYHAYHNPDATPTVARFEAFMALADGVSILTLNHPDSSPPEDEAFLRQLNAEVKRTKVGCPRTKAPGYAKDRRERWQDRVLDMHAEGMSCREIADEVFAEEGIPISHKAIWAWIRDSEAYETRVP